MVKAPKVEEEEVEPYTVEEVQRILAEAGKHRNAARWVIALALGLRQGEVLGMQWDDIDFELGVIRVRRGRLRPRYQHGGGDRCGRKPGFCPQKINIPPGDEEREVPSRPAPDKACPTNCSSSSVAPREPGPRTGPRA
ncbi:tyrosine-type recombinase/integrase [Streptomyces sp. NPDC048110]|uniref:tyrosine-type recombinase/integrase n=1 Tax=Streptomyces sp. NPDC048110 TaxID=3155483 RepID=UPI0033FF5EB9